MKNHLSRYHTASKNQVNNAAVTAYCNFQVIKDVVGEKSLNGRNGKAWFKNCLKWLSDQLMEFFEDEAWREMINKEGKRGRLVLK